MGLETGTYISDLISTNPTSNDPKSQGDDHIRLLKATIKTTFPNVNGAVNATPTELNYSVGVTSLIQTQLNTLSTGKGAIAGQTWTGNHTFPATTYGVTASLGDSSTKFATTAFVAGTAFASALPAQTGNAGKFVTTNGTTASWAQVLPTYTGNTLKFLRVNAGETDVEWVTPTPPALILISTITPTAAANIDALTVFSSTYDNYLIMGDGLGSSADDSLALRAAVAGAADAGTSYIEVSNNLTNSTATNRVIVFPNNTTSGVGGSFIAHITNVNSSTSIKKIQTDGFCQDQAVPRFNFRTQSTAHTPANTLTGFRLFWFSGANFKAQGKIRIYGYQNS